jgi:hypothetical protein
VADWQEYFGYYKGYQTFANDNYWGFLILQNWGTSGTWHTGYALLHHPGDAVGPYLKTPFTASGRQFWSSWTTEFASGLKRELDTRSGIYYETLAYPAVVDVDYEDGFDDVLPASGTGWWILVTGDARYSTQTVAQTFVSGSMTNRTLSGLYADYIARGGSAPNLTQSVFHSSNSGFFSFINYVNSVCKDYAMQEALYNPLRVQFPRINCGNYEHTTNVSGTFVYDKFNLTSAFTHSTGLVKVSNVDHQAPNFYGPQMTFGRFDNNAGFGSGNSTIWRTFNQRLIDSCTTSSIPVIPWVMPSGAATDNGVAFTPSQSDLEFVLNYAASKGISSLKWFYGSSAENYFNIDYHMKYFSSRVRYYNNIKMTVYQDGSGQISGPGGGGGLPEL